MHSTSIGALDLTLSLLRQGFDAERRNAGLAAVLQPPFDKKIVEQT
jgi:hypothetical protein